ncbi:hypothetical protein VMCG_08460 [Cytospora schulzeri]|uniref:WSC domain-containing protein n=1 Tax=Cytospora schulzeri TaxID=448051 RepID=A0A423VWQ2_9PEZI|nr:hypothetical protein VMCG_08460 [Valsa malicola]
MAVALSFLVLADAAQAQTSNEKVTTTIRATTTTTRSLARTETITIRTTASAAPGGTMGGAEEYLLQGCYGQDGQDDVGTMLGANYTTRNATTGSGGMTLSMCLGLCGPWAHQPYPYVGVSNGKECYCGTSLASTATQAHPENCAVPCEGNKTVACGGHSFMLIYKLTGPTDIPQNTTDSSSANDNDDGDKDGKSSPGITAAVVMGSICGFGVLLLLLFLGARRWTRRNKRLADGGHDEHEPSMGLSNARAEMRNIEGLNTITTNPPYEKDSTGNATRVELRRLDGIVMDGQFSPIDRPTLELTGDGFSSRRPSYAYRTGEIMSATTGTDWRNASPVTPRGGGGMGMGMGTGTPQSVSAMPEDATWDDIPHTPSILIQHPNSVAQNHGLGERAWNRRRLSTAFLPAGYTFEDTSVEEEEERIGRRAAAAAASSSSSSSSSSLGSGASARVTDLRTMESLIPPPLDLPRSGRDIDDSLALSDGDGALLSPKWTVWTKWSLPSSSPVSGSFVANANANANRSEKAGKVE